MEKVFEALQKFLDDYLALCEKLHTNQQEKMLLDKNSPYNVLKQALLSTQENTRDKAFILQKQNTPGLITLGQLLDDKIIKADEVNALWCKGNAYFTSGKAVCIMGHGNFIDTGRNPIEVINQNKDKKVYRITLGDEGLVISLTDITMEKKAFKVLKTFKQLKPLYQDEDSMVTRDKLDYCELFSRSGTFWDAYYLEDYNDYYNDDIMENYKDYGYTEKPTYILVRRNKYKWIVFDSEEDLVNKDEYSGGINVFEEVLKNG